uniref:Sporulation related domain-containing protein n=1 Tax=Candidatus Kentrum sp. TC TaxID=2126339 RepID=A0A450Z1N5_9GAMM|nr:MAG: hypothetical protein BECKTC1821D_GA0114238_105016 [Candidatus Kentron sp. TC]
MKRVFYLLVMVNIAYFVWQTGYVEPSPASSPETPKLSLPGQVDRLLLFDEVELDRLELRTAAASRLPQKGPVSLATSTPTESVTEPKSATRVAERREEKKDPPVCRKIGPLSRKANPDAIKAWLKARGITTISRTGLREVVLHWAYFPPFQTRADANEYADRLKGDGIKDIYVLPKGGMKRAISVGIFSKRSSLEKRVSELRKKGYAPSIGSRSRTEKVTWLHLASPAQATFPEIDFGKKFPLLEVARAACDD